VVAYSASQAIVATQSRRNPKAMKNAFYFSLLLVGAALVGCGRDEASTRKPELAPQVLTEREQPVPVTAASTAPTDKTQVGPITDERFQRWLDRAELAILLESQRAKERFLREWLALAEESEQKFLERFGGGPMYSGESAAIELRSFQLMRGRISEELQKCQKQQRHIEVVLNKVDHPLVLQGGANGISAEWLASTSREQTQHFRSNSSSPLDPSIMILKSYSEFGLTPQEIERLKEVGIRNPRECLEHFLHPDQQALLAALLGREHQSAVDLIQSMARQMTAAEIALLRDQMGVSRSLGVLPPPSSESTPKASRSDSP
jgi:hypothetical protein